MCSITAIISKKKKKDCIESAIKIVAPQVPRGNDAFGLTDGEVFLENKVPERFSIKKSDIALIHGRLAITGEGVMPIPSEDKLLWLAHNGEVYNYLSIGANLKKEHKFNGTTDSEYLLHFLEEMMKKDDIDLIKAVRKTMPILNGEYAFCILDKENDRFIAFNDPLGTKPLWYGESSDFLGIASEALALRRANLHFPQPLRPGNILEVTRSEIKIHKGFSIADFRKFVPKETTFVKFKEAFDEAIATRCSGLDKVGVLFSGGVDSSVVAMAVSRHVKDVTLFTAGIEGSSDICAAEKAAKEMGLKLEKVIIDEKNIEKYVLRTMKNLGEFDTMQVGIGLPILAACEAAHKKKIKVMFSGQGSDEIFAGYSYYKETLKNYSHKEVHEEIWSALQNIWARNLIRDDLVSARNMVEVRLPLLDLNFLAQAMALLPEDKIKDVNDPLRKHPIRMLAREYSVPEFVCSRKKEALQYGSGVQDLVIRAMK